MAVWAVVLWVLAGPAPAAATDTGAATEDADGDGFSVSEGDCDDGDELIGPTALEVCGDQIDNDCDGLFEEDCDFRAQMGELRGGGGCGEGLAATFVLLPGVLLLRRRKRG